VAAAGAAVGIWFGNSCRHEPDTGPGFRRQSWRPAGILLPQRKLPASPLQAEPRAPRPPGAVRDPGTAIADAVHRQSTRTPVKKLSLRSRSVAVPLLAAACAGLSLAAQAQATSTDPSYADPVRTAQASTASRSGSSYASNDGYSLLPYTRRGYVGISLGRPEFKNGCGNGAYGCDNPDVAVSLYTGGLFNEWLGMELGYTNTGKAARAGGNTRAQGVGVSLVARAPMGAFSVFAKGGAIYGQTQVSTGLLSDVSAGKRRGWGGTYGAGVGYDFTPASGVVLEWTRHEFLFPGNGGRQDVDTASLGYVQRF
jgi:hypothetical protein